MMRPVGGFELPLPPQGKGRPRLGKGGHVITPKKTRTWEAAIALAATKVSPDAIVEGPVAVEIVAVMPRPKRLLRKSDPDGLIPATTRPDSDNIAKAVIDGMKAVWRDDAQVWDLRIRKYYAERTGKPRVSVLVLVPYEGAAK